MKKSWMIRMIFAVIWAGVCTTWYFTQYDFSDSPSGKPKATPIPNPTEQPVVIQPNPVQPSPNPVQPFPNPVVPPVPMQPTPTPPVPSPPAVIIPSEPVSLSEQDRTESKKVIESFLRIYLTSTQTGPTELADQLKDYTTEEYLNKLKSSQKLLPPIQIKEMTSSLVEPSYIAGGITYHVVVVSTDKWESDYWYSLKKSTDGKWKVVRQEAI
ncbi:hypothetical protein [Risungbinella massiliensis]|uniref:hypothetical protein n=1 Tax=Risungbinella massiliensis TaxID=1329796 RepID=UPI0005CC3EF0|nr:hypothetical protein [Risungbinella massiliensis]